MPAKWGVPLAVLAFLGCIYLMVTDPFYHRTLEQNCERVKNDYS
jgi:hypothetical protein